ncbi:hypothetical protein HLB44_34755 [Aquincola sp. S2]|uniref:Uncharacterized protein n=1 Tax=Pseudaquabacterium terrae TaxID=2732868 RepID=A0ABX2EU84_9BURK|nr:hypothetical protein [Aquabacterium terrae]NRF72158.1 hypothetical protein [Aquabacterium terrae]
MWADEAGTGKPESAALLTRYMNESLDMSETVLKDAYKSPQDFLRLAPRVFLAAVLAPDTDKEKMRE